MSFKSTDLKPHWFHILLALADDDRHGAEIVRVVLRQTDGRLRLWPVMLYSSLDRLAEDGLVRELIDPDERPPGASAKRRYFRITKEGKSQLAEEAEQLVELGRMARRKLATS